MTVLKELFALNEAKVQDEKYFIVHPAKGSAIDLYTEKSYTSFDAAERAIERFKKECDDIDVAEDDADDELELLDSCYVLSGKELKKKFPKLFEVRKRGELLMKEEYTSADVDALDSVTYKVYDSNKEMRSTVKKVTSTGKILLNSGDTINPSQIVKLQKKTMKEAALTEFTTFDSGEELKKKFPKLFEGATFELMFRNGQVKRFKADSREEAIKTAKGAKAKSLIKCTPTGMPIGKPIPLTEESLEEATGEKLEALKKLHARAKKISKEQGVVQHINRDKHTNNMYVSDWFDSDETVASYEAGRNTFGKDLSESADLAKKVVRGEKGPKGLFAKLDHWLTKLIIEKDANRFLPADRAVKALASYGFSGDQIHKIREVAAEAAQTAIARMQKKYGDRVPDKYLSKMGSSFAVFDLYLNVSAEIHKEFAALMRQLFDAKIDKIKDDLNIVKEQKLNEARSIPSWFQDGTKVKLMPEYADKDPNEVFTLKSVDTETGKGRIADADGKGWNISYYQVYPKNKTPAIHEEIETDALKEDAELQSLGKKLSGKTVAEPTDEVPTDEPSVENEPSAEMPAEEKPEAEAPVFKVNDKVKPLSGPHKGEVHTVVKVLPNGTLDITLDGADTTTVKYTKGGANARPDQVQLAESLSKGSLLKQIAEGRNDTMMPLSYKPAKGHKIEAYGRKGMKNTMWRKYFKSYDELNKWAEDNDATVEGSRVLDKDEIR